MDTTQKDSSAPNVVDLDDEVRAGIQEARLDAGERGRPDLAAERIVALLGRIPGTTELAQPLFNELARLAERPEGREARRALWRHYKEQGQHDSALQISRLSMSIGRRDERFEVIAHHCADRVRQGVRGERALLQAFESLACAELPEHEATWVLVRAWFLCKDSDLAWTLLDAAARRYEIEGDHRAAIISRVQATAALYGAQEKSPLREADRLRRRILRDLEDQGAAAIPLVRQILNDEVPVALDQSLRFFLACALAQHAHAFEEARQIVRGLIQRYGPNRGWVEMLEDLEHDDGAGAIRSSLSVAPLNAEVDARIDELKIIIDAQTASTSAYIELAQLLADLGRSEEELAIRGQLADRLESNEARAQQYRRCATLLLELGDRLDAIRVRAEAAYLDRLTDDDAHFIARIAQQDRCFEKTVEILRELRAHLSGPHATAFAALEARTQLQAGTHPAAIWRELWEQWQRAPDDTFGTVTVCQLAEMHREAGRDLLRFLDSSRSHGRITKLTTVEWLANCALLAKSPVGRHALAVAAAIADPLAPERLQNLKATASANNRSVARALRDVFRAVHSISARRTWARAAASALEHEGLLDEAADVWFALSALEEPDSKAFRQALQCLYRAQDWQRLSLTLEKELIRTQSTERATLCLEQLFDVCANHLKDCDRAARIALRAGLAHYSSEEVFKSALHFLDRGGYREDAAQLVESRAWRLGESPRARDLHKEAARRNAQLHQPPAPPPPIARSLADVPPPVPQLDEAAFADLLSEPDSPTVFFESSEVDAVGPVSTVCTARDDGQASALKPLSMQASELWHSLLDADERVRSSRFAALVEELSARTLWRQRAELSDPLYAIMSAELLAFFVPRERTLWVDRASGMLRTRKAPSLDTIANHIAVTLTTSTQAAEALAAQLKAALHKSEVGERTLVGDAFWEAAVPPEAPTGTHPFIPRADLADLAGDLAEEVSRTTQTLNDALPELRNAMSGHRDHLHIAPEDFEALTWLAAWHMSGSFLTCYVAWLAEAKHSRAKSWEALCEQCASHAGLAAIMTDYIVAEC